MKWMNQIFVIFSFVNFHVAISETLEEALVRYIKTDSTAGNNALNGVKIQEKISANVLNNTYQNIILNLSDKLQNFNEQIEMLQDELDFLEISDTICQEEVQNLLNSSELNGTITLLRVSKEKIEIYDKILDYILEEGINKINSFHSKVTAMWIEMTNCNVSTSPEICNETLYNQILKRMEKCPQEYEEVVQDIQTQMTEHEIVYKTRSTAYEDEMKENLKPLVTLMKSCVRFEISRRKLHDIIEQNFIGVL